MQGVRGENNQQQAFVIFGHGVELTGSKSPVKPSKFSSGIFIRLTGDNCSEKQYLVIALMRSALSGLVNKLISFWAA